MTPSAPVIDKPRALIDAGAPLRLNLGGCGEGFLEGRLQGYLTMDLRDGADIIGDCSDLVSFDSGSVSEIYASNILEHWSLNRTVGVLKEWGRVLKPKGILRVSVPDFDAAVKLYQRTGLTEWLRYHLWGDQKHPLNYHYTCFTFATLAKDLTEAGFSDVKRVEYFNIGEKDGSLNLNTVTLEPISLNVVATK